MQTITLREYDPADSLEAITDLLHRAYAPLAAKGLQFVATYQDVETTRSRIECGRCFVALHGERIVGTITVYGREADSECELYRREDLMHFGQFAVEPDLQGTGLGRRLLAAAEEYAMSQGATQMALDTANGAVELIALYTRWGFKIVGSVDWPVTNYVSVVMAKPLPRGA